MTISATTPAMMPTKRPIEEARMTSSPVMLVPEICLKSKLLLV